MLDLTPQGSVLGLRAAASGPVGGLTYGPHVPHQLQGGNGRDRSRTKKGGNRCRTLSIKCGTLEEAGRMTDLNDVLFLCQEPPVADGGALRAGMAA